MGSANVMTEEVVRKIVEEGQQFIERKELTLACNHFGQALGEIVEKYGEQHEILGDVYYYYGMALLGLVREESDVLPENMFNKPDEEQDDSDSEDAVAPSDEKDEKTEEEKPKASDENGDKATVNGDEKKENGEKDDEKKENGEKGDEKKENGEKEAKNDEKTDEEKVGSSEENDQVPDSSNDKTETNGDAEKTDETEDVPDLQVAWEVLELAKKIFVSESRQDMLVNTLNLLGEVSLESENFDTAVEDFSESLKIQKDNNYGSRQQADIHFKLGLAYSMLNKFDDAVSHFKNSQELLNERIKALKETTRDGGMTEEEKTEIGEMEALLPEIDGKISDLIAYKDETQKSVMKLLAESSKEENGASTSSSTSSQVIDTTVGIKKVETSEVKDKDVNDISHLVRRKRKLEDDANEAEACPSKVRPSL